MFRLDAALPTPLGVQIVVHFKVLINERKLPAQQGCLPNPSWFRGLHCLCDAP
jgi:hypothetical protein